MLLAAVMMFAFVGCNGETTPTTESGTPATSDTTDTTDTTETTETTETTQSSENNPGNTEPKEEPLKRKTFEVLQNLDKIKVNGRGIEADGGITADWSASGIEFNAYCEGSVKIYTKANCTGIITFQVFVDGVEQKTPAIFNNGESGKLIVRGLARGNHNIRLVRKTMVESGNVGQLISIQKIEIFGELAERPADKDLMIEFLGDSITCGYGIDGYIVDENTGKKTDTLPNGSYTWAVQVAEALNADFSTMSISGLGVYLGTSRHNERNLSMSTAYDLNNWYRSTSTKHEPTRKADIVVINLNTNDNAQVKALVDDDLERAKQEYIAAVKLLIQKIKATHGEDVKIVWVGGMMSNSSNPDNVRADTWLKELFAELGGEAAGYYLKMDLDRNGSGPAGHPVAEYHEENAKKIVGYIKASVLPDEE